MRTDSKVGNMIVESEHQLGLEFVSIPISAVGECFYFEIVHNHKMFMFFSVQTTYGPR